MKNDVEDWGFLKTIMPGAIPDLSPPTYEALLARVTHLESDLVTACAQLAVACKELDRSEVDITILRDKLNRQNLKLAQFI